MQKRKGFTTVELVIVIAVIAILATALIPTFGGLIKSANHNVDVQTANQLTTLVIMHAVDHKIESERDLADAIDAEMGAGYYAKLEAKSAKYGYCFWYDYKEQRVHVGTVEEITDIATEKGYTLYHHSGALLANGVAGSTSNSNPFGLRGDLIPGFVLMGFKGGNDLMDLINYLESAEDVGAYTDALDAIRAADSSNPAIARLQSKANTTVIHNEHGVFAPDSTVTDVHIPQGTSVLSNNRSVSDLSVKNITVAIPTGTIVASGSLSYLGEGCIVDIDITADALPDNIKLHATGAKIEVSNGDRYYQDLSTVSANIFILDGGTDADKINGEITEEEANNLLKSYVLGDNNHDYVYVDTSAKVIYISKDWAWTEKISLVAESFLNANNESATYGIFSWAINGTATADTGKSIAIDNTATSITVKTMGIEYTYEVKTAKVESIAISTIGNLKPARSISYDSNNRSWVLDTQIKLTGNIPLNSLKLDKTVSIFSDSNSRFTITSKEDGSATLSIGSTLTGSSTNRVTFACSGTNTDEMSLTLLDCSQAAFTPNPDANTNTKYGFGFVVGTTGYNVTLGDLFVPNGVDSISADIVLSKDGNSEWKSYTADTNWNTITLNELPGFTTTNGTLSIYIKVKNGQYSAPTVLDIKPGAYNVASATDWANYKTEGKTGTNIAVLKSFTIDGTNTADTALQYALSVGAGDVYGNFKPIQVVNFIVKATYTGNYIISASAGSVIDRVIIIGPDYGNKVVIDNSGSESTGTFVTAVKATSGTEAAPVKITNCFLSGFRSPLNAGAGKTVVENTTLHRGNYANLYVDGQATLELTNVTTVQYKANGNVGGGISYKHNAGPTQSLTATNLKQYNFLTQAEITEVVKSAGGTAASLAGLVGLNLDVTTTDLGKIAAVKHNFNGTDYYHLGITALSMPIVASIGSSNNPANLDGLDVTYGENTDCSDKMTVNKQYTDVLDWFKKKDGVILYVWGLPTAGAGVLPETNITAHITEFLTDRGVTEANRNAFCTEYKTILDAAS